MTESCRLYGFCINLSVSVWQKTQSKRTQYQMDSNRTAKRIQIVIYNSHSKLVLHHYIKIKYIKTSL